MGSEDYRYITHKDKKLNVSSSNELDGSNSKEKKYKLILTSADVAILHPSFLCPALKQPKDDLHLIVLTDKVFFNTYEKAEGKEDKKAGPALSGAVNRFLKIVDWSSIDKSCHADKPVFESLDDAKKNIEVYYLWNLGDLDNFKLTKTDKDRKGGELFAQIHPDVLKMYQAKGLNHGFEIIIKDLPQGNGLYDISWMNYSKSKNEDETGYFFELQDGFINDYNNEFRKEYQPLKCDVSDPLKPLFTEEKTEIQSYHPLYISEKACLDIGQLSDVHISSRQHLFTQSNARLIDGKDGSYQSDAIGSMVNTSYATLKDLMTQMGEDIDLLIFTGDLIDYNRNFNPDNTKNGLEQLKKSGDIWKALNLDNLNNKKMYPVGIDNLVMYELFRWYYSTFNKPIMLVSGNHEAYTLPYGISPRIKLWRSMGTAISSGKYVQVMDEAGKPMYDAEGYPLLKHEKYSEKEVIEKSSSEAQQDRLESQESDNPDIYFDRANEGIPADHNLTIQEAILMYGSDYARVIMAAASDEGGERNFKPENLEWFYKIFTPLTSFWTNYSDQCFIGLGWGDNEKFVGKAQGKWAIGGFLPRATESVSEDQLDIVNIALAESKQVNILCSHFTYANYNVPQPTSEQGEINYNDLFGTLGKHDFGTFEKNRKAIYKKITENDIHYTLSGHSHRSGLYQVLDADKSWMPGRSTMSVTGHVANNNRFNPDTGCRMLVAACGGPIAVQNHENELFNWGLDTPSGNVIKFNGSSEKEVGLKRPSLSQSKPRISVAMDYADIFLRDKKKQGLITEFRSLEDDGAFTIIINKEARLNEVDLFEQISLIFYDDNKSEVTSGITTLEKVNEYRFTTKNSIRKLLKKMDKDKPVTYIRIQCTPPKKAKHFEQYNTSSDWIFPIEIIRRGEVEVKKYKTAMATYGIPYTADTEQELKKLENLEGFIVDRHSIYGEIPDIVWYTKKFGDEYFE